MLTLAQWIARLTKGYIKFTGKKPDKLSKLKIKMEAGQKVKDQKKVIKVDFNKKKPWHKEKEIDWDKVNKIDIEDFAGGGIAGMLGEPTYVDDSHRVPFKDAKSVEGPYMGPQNFYDIGFGSILDDVMRDSPKKRYTEKDLKNIWNILQGEHDVENWEDELMF